MRLDRGRGASCDRIRLQFGRRVKDGLPSVEGGAGDTNLRASGFDLQGNEGQEATPEDNEANCAVAAFDKRHEFFHIIRERWKVRAGGAIRWRRGHLLACHVARSRLFSLEGAYAQCEKNYFSRGIGETGAQGLEKVALAYHQRKFGKYAYMYIYIYCNI